MGHYDDMYAEENNSPIDVILKRWIIVHAPGKTPTIKHPVNSDDGLIEMLQEMISLYPNYKYTVIRLVYGNNIWVDDGVDYIHNDIKMENINGNAI